MLQVSDNAGDGAPDHICAHFIAFFADRHCSRRIRKIVSVVAESSLTGDRCGELSGTVDTTGGLPDQIYTHTAVKSRLRSSEQRFGQRFARNLQLKRRYWRGYTQVLRSIALVTVCGTTVV
ncbi:MAG: hypothetical protein JWO13_816 [Acidobacteriales bacterium]|nr:hypothetical protein [Terriglobales bacterium]